MSLKYWEHRNTEGYIDHYMWVSSPNHISKQPHKDSWHVIDPHVLIWCGLGAYKPISTVMSLFLSVFLSFFRSFFPSFFLSVKCVHLKKASYKIKSVKLNFQWITIHGLSGIILFLTKRFHQWLYCAWMDLLIVLLSNPWTNTKHRRLRKLWLMSLTLAVFTLEWARMAYILWCTV